ncbi:MAG: response regulator [Nocardioides sp.]|nr:response regulator [Nocardioides sp.]
MSTPLALVVDDDEDVRMITRLALVKVAGWQVVDTDRGAKALDLAREHQPAVILLDLMMPEMDGIETAQRLLADPATAHIPIVMVTAKKSVGEAQPWDDLPVAGVVAKPFDPMSLADELVAMLGWQK